MFRINRIRRAVGLFALVQLFCLLGACASRELSHESRPLDDAARSLEAEALERRAVVDDEGDFSRAIGDLSRGESHPPTRISLQEEAAGTRPAAAEGSASSEDDDGWEFAGGLFLWDPGLSGHITVDANRSEIDLTPIEFLDAVIDNFSFVTMLNGEARKGPIFVDVDFIYLGLSDDLRRDTPLGTLKLDVDLDIVIVKTLLGYEFYKIPFDGEKGTPGFSLSALAGGTLWYARLNTESTFGDNDASEVWFDPAIGLRADLRFAENWDLRVQGDVGGFGVGSSFAWGFLASLGWHVSESTQLSAGWLILSSDYRDGEFEWDMELSGPVLSAMFRF